MKFQLSALRSYRTPHITQIMISDTSLILLNFLNSASVTGPWLCLYLQTSAPVSGVNQEIQMLTCLANYKPTNF